MCDENLLSASTKFSMKPLKQTTCSIWWRDNFQCLSFLSSGVPLSTLQTNTLLRFPVWEARLWDFIAAFFIILLFPESFPPITEKYFQIKLSCVVEDDGKLTHIIEEEQFLFKSHASFCRSTATIIKVIRKPVKIAGFFPWHSAGNWLEWTTGSVVSREKWCHIINYLLTSLARDRTGEYWPLVVFVRTSLRSVRTATTSGQYSPVRPSRSVSKRLEISPVIKFGPHTIMIWNKKIWAIQARADKKKNRGPVLTEFA